MQPHTSIYQVTAGVIRARSLLVLMKLLTWEMLLFRQHQSSPSHNGSSCDARKELAGTLTWKMIMLTTEEEAQLCLHLCFALFLLTCILYFVVWIPCYRPMLFTLCPDTLITPAWSCSGLQHPRLSLCCLLCMPCCSAELPWQECGSYCGRFCDFLQLCLVKTQARPTPLRSSRAIKLPCYHIAYDIN